MADTPLPLELPPGMVVTESIFAASGRYVGGDKVRFYRNKPQKIGGNSKHFTTAYTGFARALLAWSDFSLNNFVMVGTNCKLEIYDSNGNKTNVTPLEDTGTLAADPITTTSGSTSVNIEHGSHGRIVGDVVVFDGATAVGGITIDGEYTVSTYVDGNNYTIEHSSAATGSATGGGSSVDYDYELTCGLVDATEGGGWGIGGWGEETWGTSRQNTTFVQYPRFWSLSKYGEDVIACPTNGTLYHWDATNQTSRAAAISNAPSNCQAAFVTDDRHVVALGAGGDPMKVQWPDQSDFTAWTPSSTNTAGSRTLQEGSRLMAGGVLQNRVALIWSDTAAYLWQYTGSDFVFDSRVAGNNCGLIGPNAFTVVGGVAYWMSRGNFYMYSGYVVDIPNADDINSFVDDNISDLQDVKTVCGYNQVFDEIWWWFVAEGEYEPSIYVAYNMKSKTWVKGTMSRSAFANQENRATEPLMTGVAEDDYVYVHETGLNEADGSAIAWSLEMAPFAISQGGQVMDVWHLEPDFETQVGDITLNLKTYHRSRVASLLDNETYTIAATDDIVDTDNVSGRYVSLTWSQEEVDGDFRFGISKLRIDQAGERG